MKNEAFTHKKKQIKIPHITYEALKRELPLFFEKTGSTALNTLIISILNEHCKDTIEEIRAEQNEAPQG